MSAYKAQDHCNNNLLGEDFNKIKYHRECQLSTEPKGLSPLLNELFYCLFYRLKNVNKN